jgi:hypothetical protein
LYEEARRFFWDLQDTTNEDTVLEGSARVTRDVTR